MNIFDILKNLYTNKESKWILEVNDSDVQPYLVQRWLVMNEKIRKYSRWLDKYVFDLTPKQYLSLAWSVIPKETKTPFVKYIKKQEEDDTFDFITVKIRKHYDMADNDYRVMKERIITDIKKDPEPWFAFYGIEKQYWAKFGLKFENIAKYGAHSIKTQKSLFQY